VSSPTPRAIPVTEDLLNVKSIAGWGIIVWLLLALPSSAAAGPFVAEGYAWPPCVAQGDTVGLYVSTDGNFFDLEVRRLGYASVPHYQEAHLPGLLQTVPDSAWSEGCGWVPSKLLPIPSFWKSGVYEVEIKPQAGVSSPAYALFVVREDDPAHSSAKILYQVSLSTWQAYNNWGGKSLYSFNSTDSVAADIVSFQRPYAKDGGRGDVLFYDLPIIRWLEEEGYLVDYCTSLDTHADPGLQDPYPLFLSTGHDEYWSKEMRDNIEARIAGGKDVAFLSGNICWWQVRFSPGMERMICYKDAAEDPLTGIDDARVTVNWCESPVLRPENFMTGVSYRNGGYVNYKGWYPASEGYGGYTAYRTDHWVFAGTGLSDGEEFGTEATIVGYETDGASFSWSSPLPVATGEDGTPSGFEILGVSPASKGWATMGIYTQGGTVFTAATTDWGHGLEEDEVVARITRNVINRAVGFQVGVPDVQPGTTLTSCPNPFRFSTSISFEAPEHGRVQLRVVDVAGRLVTTLCREDLEAGSHSVVWRGDDAAGRAVASGVYFLSLEDGSLRSTRRIVKLP
jgi:hypothetical protein